MVLQRTPGPMLAAPILATGLPVSALVLNERLLPHSAPLLERQAAGRLCGITAPPAAAVPPQRAQSLASVGHRAPKLWAGRRDSGPGRPGRRRDEMPASRLPSQRFPPRAAPLCVRDW